MAETAMWEEIDLILRRALAEDIGSGDVTSLALVPAHIRAVGYFLAKTGGILAGMSIVERLYHLLEPGVSVKRLIQEGEKLEAGSRLATIEGPARAILAGERVALNILQRMCGVATLTRAYVNAVADTGVEIYDTRKTMPGLRALDKLAVLVGGGLNHRRGLYDMILIKDNHLAVMFPACPEGSIACAVQRARQASQLPLEVEVRTIGQVEEAVEAGADMILLDNMDLETMAEAVKRGRELCLRKGLRRPLFEASGGITLDTVRAAAKCGVDRISIGALTHSAKALDISLEIGA